MASDAATRREGQDRRRRGRPAGGALGRGERPDRIEPHVRIETPPATEPRDRPVARVALVDEDRADRPGSAVEVLVGAPGGEVDVPLVERELDVAGRVGEVPADDGSRGVAGSGETLDVERLPGREVDPGQEDQGEVVGVRRDGRLEVCGPDDGLAVTGPDHHEICRRVEPALGQVARQGVPVRREEWVVGEDPPAPAGWTEERDEQQVDVDGQAVEQRHLDRVRADDPAHRLAQRSVEREPRAVRVEPGVDAEARPGVELGRDGRRRGSRL